MVLVATRVTCKAPVLVALEIDIVMLVFDDMAIVVVAATGAMVKLVSVGLETMVVGVVIVVVKVEAVLAKIGVERFIEVLEEVKVVAVAVLLLIVSRIA